MRQSLRIVGIAAIVILTGAVGFASAQVVGGNFPDRDYFAPEKSFDFVVLDQNADGTWRVVARPAEGGGLVHPCDPTPRLLVRNERDEPIQLVVKISYYDVDPGPEGSNMGTLAAETWTLGPHEERYMDLEYPPNVLGYVNVNEKGASVSVMDEGFQPETKPWD